MGWMSNCLRYRWLRERQGNCLCWEHWVICCQWSDRLLIVIQLWFVHIEGLWKRFPFSCLWIKVPNFHSYSIFPRNLIWWRDFHLFPGKLSSHIWSSSCIIRIFPWPSPYFSHLPFYFHTYFPSQMWYSCSPLSPKQLKLDFIFLITEKLELEKFYQLFQQELLFKLTWFWLQADSDGLDRFY